jgi:hypothetical protein
MYKNSLTEYINLLRNKFVNLYQVNHNAKELLIYGMPQSGKSAFTFANAVIQLVKGKSCIFIVRNSTQDAIHMQEKAKRFSQMLISNGLQSLDTVYAGDMVCNWEINNEVKILKDVDNYKHIQEALFGNKKKMVIALANMYQLSALNYLCEIHNKHSPIVLLIDEADSLSYGIPDIPTNIEFSKLKEFVSQKIEITATPWDNLIGNENLQNQDIIILEPPRHYHSIRSSIIFHELQYPIDKFKDNLIEEDANFVGFYEEMSVHPFFEKEKHPVIVLHKTCTLCKHHKVFFDYFKENYPNWVVIKEDSDNICMFAITLGKRRIVINGTHFKGDGGVYTFHSKIIIPQILQWLYDNGGVSMFPRIVIKSGHFSGRSRSYVSTNGIWHLTHQYYNGAKTIPALIQEMRLVHDRPDSIPLRCYAPKDVCQNIQRSAIMLDEQMDRLITQKSGVNVSSFVREGKWNKNKLPAKKIKLTVGKANSNFNLEKVDQDDGWNINSYKTTTIKEYEDEVIVMEDGIFIIVDMDKFEKNSKVHKMINDVMCIIIQNNKVGEDNSIDWVNKELQKQSPYSNMTIDCIRGNLWTNIRTNKRLKRTNNKEIKEDLIYWKNNKGIFVRLN